MNIGQQLNPTASVFPSAENNSHIKAYPNLIHFHLCIEQALNILRSYIMHGNSLIALLSKP